MYIHSTKTLAEFFLEANTRTPPLEIPGTQMTPVLEKTLLDLFWPQNRRLGGGFKHF